LFAITTSCSQVTPKTEDYRELPIPIEWIRKDVQ